MPVASTFLIRVLRPGLMFFTVLSAKEVIFANKCLLYMLQFLTVFGSLSLLLSWTRPSEREREDERKRGREKERERVRLVNKE